jgi:7-carboxy-7-deazaguanine synthase
MPRGAARAVQRERMAAVWQFCVDHHFNFAPRLHILAFDNKRGV